MSNTGKSRGWHLSGSLDMPAMRVEFGAPSPGLGQKALAQVSTRPKRISAEQAAALGRQLQLAVEVDTTGWLRDGVEIRVTLGPGRTLHPTAVRVAPDAAMDQLLEGGGVVERCARYNRALGELCNLRERLAALVGRGHTCVEPGSAVWSAQRALSRLETDIASRQTARMGSNVVSLQVLDAEIGFLHSYLRYLATITVCGEQAEQAKLWDVETQDLDPFSDYTD